MSCNRGQIYGKYPCNSKYQDPQYLNKQEMKAIGLGEENV